MPAYTFKVTVKATDRIFSLTFCPEKSDDTPIIWHRKEGFTKYVSDEFDVDVTGDFDYQLTIGARNTVKYNYTIQVKSGTKWLDVKVEKDRLIRIGNKDVTGGSVAIPTTTKPLPPIV